MAEKGALPAEAGVPRRRGQVAPHSRVSVHRRYSLFLGHKNERKTVQELPDYQAFSELVCTMLGIGGAENRSFQPVAPPVWIKEFPPFSHSPPGSNRDFGIWAGIGGDSGDGQSQSITGVVNSRHGRP